MLHNASIGYEYIQNKRPHIIRRSEKRDYSYMRLIGSSTATGISYSIPPCKICWRYIQRGADDVAGSFPLLADDISPSIYLWPGLRCLSSHPIRLEAQAIDPNGGVLTSRVSGHTPSHASFSILLIVVVVVSAVAVLVLELDTTIVTAFIVAAWRRRWRH